MLILMKRENLTNFFFSRNKLTINIENFSRLFYIYYSFKLTPPYKKIEAQNMIEHRKIGYVKNATDADSGSDQYRVMESHRS